MQRHVGWAWAVNLWFLSAVGGTAGAQSTPREESPRNAVETTFNRKSPDVGELVPNLTAYRADGSAVRLLDLEGKVTVLVFGCLT